MTEPKGYLNYLVVRRNDFGGVVVVAGFTSSFAATEYAKSRDLSTISGCYRVLELTNPIYIDDPS
jgi:hypothetical protein